ncbi:MAG: aldo/keto reductase [Clostridia bacterium]|nr:aldo/keto reductase [Clostridia bacterium]
MIYKNFQDKKLSALGMGCMRLPTIKDDQDKIDENAVREMVAYAIEKGVNYFDTAWGYHNGQSEIVMGKTLKEYPRESFYLADKFPGYDLNNMDKVEEIFETQLKKCQVEYFDFYLVHNVCELNINEYLDPKYGVYAYLKEQKKNGRIKHLGFSVHGSLDTMKRFLEVYGEDMEFCQIQLNWLDWELQNAKAKLALLNELNIPVWVMEPVRGGALVRLEESQEEVLKGANPNRKTVEWAFRYLQSLDGVCVTLSGMSNMEQLKENIAIFEREEKLTQEEMETLQKVAQMVMGKDKLPCTSCRYCTAHCPMELNIPWIIELYNEYKYSGGGFLVGMAIGSLSDDKKPSACIGCRACEAVCPQTIKISEMMTDFSKGLEK